MSFRLAIIGRPNVGKSTLFNRLVGKKLALVHDTPGLTRDWKEAPAQLFDLNFTVIDTAGLEESFDDSIPGRMRKQTESALKGADMAMLVVDARQGLTPMDKHFADWLRRQNIPCMLVANKCESKVGEAGLHEAYSLGLGDPLPVSAEHNMGMEHIYDALRAHLEPATPADGEDDEAQARDVFEEGSGTGFGDLEETEEADDTQKPIKLAIVGRPNVGKSTLVNSLLGDQRVMTGPEPGVTRDAISIDWEYNGRQFRLVDTAGMRRKAKVVDYIEKMSVEESLRTIRLAQVVVLVLDANMILDKQDLQIAAHVIDEGRALVIAINKWDAVENRQEALDRLRDRLNASLTQVQKVPTVTISALKGQKLDTLMDAVLNIYGVWNQRVSTGRLNRWLAGMEQSHPAPLVQGRQNRLRYMTQVKARPPTFAIWVSRPSEIPDSYRRYLVNGLRETFDMPGTPIRLNFRSSKNPYVD